MSNRHSSQTDKSDLPGNSGNANSPAPDGYEDPMAELARIVAGDGRREEFSAQTPTTKASGADNGADNGSNVHSILAVEPELPATASMMGQVTENAPVQNAMADNSELLDLESQLMAELGEVSLTQTPSESVTPPTQALEQLAQEPVEQASPAPQPVEEKIEEMNFDAALEAQLMESTQLSQNAEAQLTQNAETSFAVNTPLPVNSEPVEPAPAFDTPVQIQQEPQSEYLPSAANANEVQPQQAPPIDEYYKTQPVNSIQDDQAQRDQLFAELQSTGQADLEQPIEPAYEPAVEQVPDQYTEQTVEPAFVPAVVEPIVAEPIAVTQPVQVQPAIVEETVAAQMAPATEFSEPQYHPANAPVVAPAALTPAAIAPAALTPAALAPAAPAPTNANLSDDEFLEDEFESVFADEFASELADDTQSVTKFAPEPMQFAQPAPLQIPAENLAQPDNFQQYVQDETVAHVQQPEFVATIPDAPAELATPAPIAAQSFDPAFVPVFDPNIAPAPPAIPEANFEFEQPVEPLPEYSAQLDDFDPNQDQLVKPAATGRRWKLMIAALFVALIAGSGAYYFGVLGNAIGTSGPKLVKAVDGPFKVKPENPGGKNIANQDQPVYDNLNGNASQGTTQEKLVTDMEEPLTVTPRSVASSSSLNPDTPRKTAERLPSDTSRSTSTSQAPFPIIQPRRVKTVTVKPDGTILSGNGNLAALSSPTSQATLGLAPNSVDGAVSSGKLPIPSVNPRFKKSTSEPAGIKLPAAAQELLEPVSAPAAAPIAPVQRLASLDIPKTRSLNIAPRETVPNISNIKTASIPAPTVPNSVPIKVATVPSSAYVVQVSSQRSPEAAKASYENLKRRFAGLLEGQPSEIRQANVDGKGIFYRVRIPQPNKSDAAKFCTRFKAAGGSCFVTR